MSDDITQGALYQKIALLKVENEIARRWYGSKDEG
jgi:hypothetical protein